MSTAPLTPAQNFAAILNRLTMVVDGRGLCGLLARPLAMLIVHRLIVLRQHIVGLMERIQAGTFTPRHRAAGKPRAASPRRPGPLPHGFAWLVRLAPVSAPFGSALGALLAEPETQALVAAAPAAMRRPLRSLCRMLGVTPPAILAIPRRKPPAPPPPAPPAARPAPRHKPAKTRPSHPSPTIAPPARTRFPPKSA